jgi:phage/plasmid-associated DNA primase
MLSPRQLIIAGNHKPELRSVDEAIRRRFHLVPDFLASGFGEE